MARQLQTTAQVTLHLGQVCYTAGRGTAKAGGHSEPGEGQICVSYTSVTAVTFFFPPKISGGGREGWAGHATPAPSWGAEDCQGKGAALEWLRAHRTGNE